MTVIVINVRNNNSVQLDDVWKVDLDKTGSAFVIRMLDGRTLYFPLLAVSMIEVQP